MQSAISRDSLIFVSAAVRAGADPRALQRAAARGDLVRVRRGTYCERQRWDQADARERHLLRVHAVVADARNAITIAGVSAAVVWGIPLAAAPPSDVVVLDRYRGGGRSEPGVVRHTSGAETAETVSVNGVPVTTLPRTVLEVARSVPFPEAVASIDWARWRKNPHAVSQNELTAELDRLSPRVGRNGLARAIDFSTELADSFAESHARAVIHELGFAPPVLQLPLADSDGRMYADFAWPEQRVIAEFDGDIKYTDVRYNGGNPIEKVRRERRRDGRLRHLGWTVVHFEWLDVVHRDRLAALLADAGVPRP